VTGCPNWEADSPAAFRPVPACTGQRAPNSSRAAETLVRGHRRSFHNAIGASRSCLNRNPVGCWLQDRFRSGRKSFRSLHPGRRRAVPADCHARQMRHSGNPSRCPLRPRMVTEQRPLGLEVSGNTTRTGTHRLFLLVVTIFVTQVAIFTPRGVRSSLCQRQTSQRWSRSPCHPDQRPAQSPRWLSVGA
jgi:hypothetical protein